MIKICSKCNVEKSLQDFYKAPINKDGLAGICKKCKKQREKAEYSLNKEEILKRNKEYRKNHKKEISQNKAMYYLNNKDVILEKNRQRSNKLENKIIAKAYKKQWQDQQSDNDNFTIKRILAARVRTAIKEQYGKKAYKTMELIGCSIEQLKQYLESKFTLNMFWDNHGLYGWHIDHIRPCASFDLSDPEQQKQCFHYTNLQPLWAKDNLSKSDNWKKVA